MTVAIIIFLFVVGAAVGGDAAGRAYVSGMEAGVRIFMKAEEERTAAEEIVYRGIAKAMVQDETVGTAFRPLGSFVFAALGASAWGLALAMLYMHINPA